MSAASSLEPGKNPVSAMRPSAADLERLQRRVFLGHSATGMLGSIALTWLNAELNAGRNRLHAADALQTTGPHFAPRAERITSPALST